MIVRYIWSSSTTLAGMHAPLQKLPEVEEKAGFNSIASSFNILIYGLYGSNQQY